MTTPQDLTAAGDLCIAALTTPGSADLADARMALATVLADLPEAVGNTRKILDYLLLQSAGALDEATRSSLCDMFARAIDAWRKTTSFTPERDAALADDALRIEVLLSLDILPDIGGGSDEIAQSVSSDEATLPDLDLSDIRDFITEGTVLLDNLEQDILNLPDADTDRIQRIFRNMHTFKGLNGMLGIKAGHHVAHMTEELLERVRSGHIERTPELESYLLRIVDRLRADIRTLQNGSDPRRSSLPYCAAVAAFLGDGPASGVGDDAKSVERTAATHAAGPALRVDIAKLDAAMEEVGELLVERIRLEDGRRRFRTLLSEATDLRDVMLGRGGVRRIDPQTAQAALVDRLTEFGESFERTVESIGRSSRELQDSVMRMRLIPLSHVLARFPRLVRDTSRKVGKSVQLELNGEHTEIDKAISEMLPEPLLHLIRNSVDHGIESPARRKEAGKPETGTIVIHARYEGDKVLIEIRDDGQGLDEERIVAKAVEKRLITMDEAEAMRPEERRELIFRPGFSTAENVSDLSGRGVGMDVVRTSVEKIGGTIHLTSEPGTGTTIRIRLPITLAILGILLCRCAGRPLALPLYAVRETLRVRTEDVYEASGRTVMNLRGEVLPLAWLDAILGVTAVRGPGEFLAVVVIEDGERLQGIVVDEFLGKQDIIIKNLGRHLLRAPFVSGGALLGDGEVVLVLDPVAVFREAAKAGAKSLLPAGPTSKASSTDSAAGGTKRILLVEDSGLVAKRVSRLLTDAGYVVTIAGSGEEALQFVRSTRFDLVSTDIVMPGMDGYEFIRQLRHIKDYQFTPVVALTSKGDRVDRVQAFQAGIDEHLTKPLDDAIYLSTVAALIQRPSASPRKSDA